MSADLADQVHRVTTASKKPWVIALGFGIIGVVALVGHEMSGPPQGFDNHCQAFAAMSHRDQVAVMVSAGVVPSEIEDRIAYNLSQCVGHPNRQIGQNF
jgi:hypothetical protein